MGSYRRRATMAIVCSALALTARTSEANAAGDEPALRTITPIYSQLVVVDLPRGFAPAFEDAKDDFYIREAVPKGQTVDTWRQMVTVTGAKGLGKKAGLTPRAYLDHMAASFQNACASSYSGEPLSEGKLGDFDMAIAVLSCGTASGEAVVKHGETTLFVVIKGQADLYSIQWAERSSASPKPLRIDLDLWRGRLRQLGPITLCPIVPRGEAAVSELPRTRGQLADALAILGLAGRPVRG